MPFISAVIILYNPDLNVLTQALTSIKDQVESIILIDNSLNALEPYFFQNLNIANKVSYIFNGNNIGLAQAQNLGIRCAITQGSEFVIIFDQDSISTSQMVQQLKADYDKLINRNIKLAAVGPEPINIQTEKPYTPRVKKFKPFFIDDPKLLNVPQIISSGALISANVLTDVGLMDEYLFIDGVDHEWCWRARTNGYTCALSQNAQLKHMLGEGDRKFLGISIAITSPFRVYYQYRNFIYLCCKSYVPVYWKLNNVLKYSIKLIYFPIFVRPRKIYFINILKGLAAGFQKILTRNK